MLKIAGGIVLGFFGIMICCVLLHECSTSNESKTYEKPSNEILANECRKLTLPRLKNPDNFTFHIDSVSYLGFQNTYLAQISLYNKQNTAELGSISCYVKQKHDNEFESKIFTETYFGNIEK
jgi:hypothetical protein